MSSLIPVHPHPLPASVGSGRSLQTKAWLISAAVLLGLAAALVVGADAVFRRSYSRLEREFVEQHVRRLEVAKDDEIEALFRACWDYANWNDTYRFIDDPSLPYIETNLLPSMFSNLQLDGFLLFHRDGRLRLGRTAIDGAVGEENIPLLTDALTPLATQAAAGGGKPVRGVVRLGGRIAVVAVLPVMRDDGSGPPNGALAEIRYLDQNRLARWRRQLGIDLRLQEPSPNSMSRDSALGSHWNFATEANRLVVQVPVTDLDNRPVGEFQITLPRDIHLQGIRAGVIFCTVLVVVVVAAAFLIGWLFRWLVIRRLEALQVAVTQVSATSDLSVRLPLVGNDELTSVADGVNRMFDALARAEQERAEADRQRESLRTQLQESQKLEALGTLAGGLGHDFNNFLTSIQGSTALVRMDAPANDAVHGHLDRIERSAKQAANLVRKMMAFARRSPTDFSAVRLLTVVNDALSLARPSVPSGISFKVSGDGTSDLVSADAGQLVQVLINLVNNASHSMAVGSGSITIELSAAPAAPGGSGSPSPRIRLVVRDTGCGIAPEHLPRVFEPFYTTKPVGSGTGLGLAVAHGIIGHHGGTIRIESELGRGTAVIIELPALDPASADGVDTAGGPPVAANARRQRVLVVDDDDSVRETLTHSLKRLGYEVVATESGDRALRLASVAGTIVDVLVTDQLMPAMTGTDLGRQFRQVQPNAAMILISGYAESLNTSKVKSFGFSTMLMKPVTLSDLDHAIQVAVGSRPPTGRS